MFKEAMVESAEQGLVLPSDAHSGVYSDGRGTVVDNKVGLWLATRSRDARRLWQLRLLFEWAKGCVERGEEMRWIGGEVVEGLRGKVVERVRVVEEEREDGS